ncbi:MAG: hypothetical protein AAGA65_30135, partial [Actinomycetota bacterium]
MLVTAALAVVTVAVVGLAVAVAFGLRQQETASLERTERQRVELVERATALAATAEQLNSAEANGLGLLLAMASDDLAAQAGGEASTFNEMARGYGSLVRILRPDNGRYESLASGHAGRYGALSTNAGTTQLVDLLTGEVVWTFELEPGLPFHPDQVAVNSLALDPDEERLAVALSDQRILVVATRGSDERMLKLGLRADVSTARGYNDARAADHVAFDSTGRWLFAAVESEGVGVFDLASNRETPIRFCPADGVVQLVADQYGTAMVMLEAEVVRVDALDCAIELVHEFEPGFDVHDMDVSGGELVVVGNDGSNLSVRSPDWERETVLAGEGPYFGLH